MKTEYMYIVEVICLLCADHYGLYIWPLQSCTGFAVSLPAALKSNRLYKLYCDEAHLDRDVYCATVE